MLGDLSPTPPIFPTTRPLGAARAAPRGQASRSRERARLLPARGPQDSGGVGIALRKMGAMAKPDCIITCDGKNLTIKTESTLKTTQFSCTLGEKFEETTADGRKTQTVCSFTDGALVQHQEWDGKESTITRKLKDGKLVVDCVMNNVTCTRIYEKVE
uniref:Fatty acid binding protein 5 n=1 Tax=Papio anubis TaxID=9555 RepID=A0A8I5NRS3_PAPAN